MSAPVHSPPGGAAPLNPGGVLPAWWIPALLATAAVLAPAGDVSAQTPPDPAVYTLVVRGVPMGLALEELARLSEIDLVYSSGLVSGKTAYCTGNHMTAEELLRCVIKGSRLDYVRTSAGTYVLIEAVRSPPLYGHLSGRIVDRLTGEPIPAANVLLADASTGTTTDGAGLFSFGTLLSGMHRIVVTYVGYETVLDTIHVAPGGRSRLQIALRPEEITLEPVVIDGLSQRLPSSRLGGDEVPKNIFLAWTASGTPDVARGAGHLPGVALHPPLADLHLEGGAGGEHLTLLDGVPVRDPVSLGRHLSAFSPLAIDRLKIHRAGFGVEHGSHLTGVVAFEHDLSGPQERQAAASVDPVSLNTQIQTRFDGPAGRRGAVMLALRSSMWDVVRDPGLRDLLRHWNTVDPLLASIWIRQEVNDETLRMREHTPDVGFSDLHAAAELPLAPFRTLQASVYRARNRIASELLALNSVGPDDPDRLILTRDDYDWTNWAGQIRHNWLLGARSVGVAQVLWSRHASRYAYHSLQSSVTPGLSPSEVRESADALGARLPGAPGSDEHNQIREVTLRTALTHSPSPPVHLEAALEATHVDSRVEIGNQFVAPFFHEATAWQIATHVLGRWTLGPRTILEPGVRLTYLPIRQTLYAEPRLALRYDRAGSPTGPYALRLAAGLYRQFVNTFELTSSGSTSVVPSVLFWLPADRTLAPPRSVHLAAESLLLPGERWTVTLTAYFKHQPRLLTLDYARLLAEHPSVRPRPDASALAQSDFVSPARGRAYGVSGHAAREGERLSASATYTLSWSERSYPGRFEGRLQPVPWNAPHRLSLDARLVVGAGFSIQAGWLGIWGRRWALRRAYYDYLALRPEPVLIDGYDFGRPADHRLPPYARLDAGITFDHEAGRMRLQARALLIDLLDRKNVYDRSLSLSEAGVDPTARTLPGRHPAFTLRLTY